MKMFYLLSKYLVFVECLVFLFSTGRCLKLYYNLSVYPHCINDDSNNVYEYGASFAIRIDEASAGDGFFHIILAHENLSVATRLDIDKWLVFIFQLQ